MSPTQLKFEVFEDVHIAKSSKVAAAVEALATQRGSESRGAIFTREAVVDFILDLAGYTADQPLYRRRILEPSFGGGDFLLPIVGRLLTAWRALKSKGAIVDEIGDAIRQRLEH